MGVLELARVDERRDRVAEKHSKKNGMACKRKM